jgi:protein-S-isoprenylcysteine O-methyltransferase Ste14
VELNFVSYITGEDHFFLWLSYWILFQHGATYLHNVFGIHDAGGSADRRIVLYVFNVVIFLRVAFTMFYLVKRRIPWEESISVPLAFAIYYVGYSLFVLSVDKPLDWLDYLAILIFVVGCTLNTAGELLRDMWKRKPENKGQLYTEGFFRYSMHINYFGDFLWVIGYAIITRNWYAASIPAFLFSFFAFYNIPKLDKYLHDKYGKDYEQYSKQTKRFIPFVY